MTFMLDHIGTNQPLTAINGMTVAGADSTNQNALICLESGLLIENGGFYISNAQVIQDGGIIRVPGGSAWLNGEYYLSSGLFEARTLLFSGIPNGPEFPWRNGLFYQYGGIINVSNLYDTSLGPPSIYTIYGGALNVSGGIEIGDIDQSYFNQYGGRVSVGSIGIGDDGWGSRYTLYGGELVVIETLNIRGVYGGSKFVQNGGTNWAGSILAGSEAGHSGSEYVLNDGALRTGGIWLDGNGQGSFDQNGGLCIVTNTLSILGVRDYAHSRVARCNLTQGTLIASNLDLDGGALEITNGSAIFGDVHAGGFSYGSIFMSGGAFSCGNFQRTENSGAAIQQNAGILTVSNLFAFGGVSRVYYVFPLRYQMAGGTLNASNIELTADMVIGSTNGVQVQNPGYFKLGGTLAIGNADIQLGTFILTSNSVINFSLPPYASWPLQDGAGKLKFSNSSAENWNNAAKLFVTNWNGSFTGGGDDQLKFGNDASALTAAQLNQIRFENPAGFSPGEYLAKILDAGEVVPKPGPAISFGQSGANFVFSWNSDFTLQTATNVSGTYEDLPNATSPYTNDFPPSPERYFRLRK